MKAQLLIEVMEERCTPSASVALSAGGVLTIHADNNADNIIVQQPHAKTVQVLVNSEGGKTYDFKAAAVKRIDFQGGDGSDVFANNTAINSVQRAGGGDGVTYLQGGTGKDVLIGGSNPNGSTYETANSGQATFIGGAGFNNIFGGKPGGSDTILAGPGRNAIYDILGTNTIDGGTGSGYLIVNATSKVSASPQEQVVTFFQSAFGTVGANTSSPVVLQKDVNGNGILYLLPKSQSADWTVNQVGSGSEAKLAITYNDADGQQMFSFRKSKVSWIASFGGTGNNSYVNNTDVNDVFYGGLGGAAVQHTIIGGFGISVIKGHSGTNYLEARGTYNDLTAGSGTDFLSGSDRGQNVFRTNRTVETTSIDHFHDSDLVLGVPQSVNGQTDPDKTGTKITNADYTFWYLFFKNRRALQAIDQALHPSSASAA
ncbi:MAG TPA: hypothetical protein VKU02_20405 [Gemmataceae bacterium]|nr:hypothetical protein [Gemmataceae bacterium]